MARVKGCALPLQKQFLSLYPTRQDCAHAPMQRLHAAGAIVCPHRPFPRPVCPCTRTRAMCCPARDFHSTGAPLSWFVAGSLRPTHTDDGLGRWSCSDPIAPTSGGKCVRRPLCGADPFAALYGTMGPFAASGGCMVGAWPRGGLRDGFGTSTEGANYEYRGWNGH